MAFAAGMFLITRAKLGGTKRAAARGLGCREPSIDSSRSRVDFKGNLLQLDIFFIFPGRLGKMEGTFFKGRSLAT